MVERVEVVSTYTPHEYQLKARATSTAASDEGCIDETRRGPPQSRRSSFSSLPEVRSHVQVSLETNPRSLSLPMMGLTIVASM